MGMILLWMLAEVFRKTSCPIEIFCGTHPCWTKPHRTAVAQVTWNCSGL